MNLNSKPCSTTSEKLFSTSPYSIARNDLDNQAIKSKHNDLGGKQRNRNGIGICLASEEKRQLNPPKKWFWWNSEAINDFSIAPLDRIGRCWVGNLAQIINPPIETSAEISSDGRHADPTSNESAANIKAVCMWNFSPSSAAAMSSRAAIFHRFHCFAFFRGSELMWGNQKLHGRLSADPWDWIAFDDVNKVTSVSFACWMHATSN